MAGISRTLEDLILSVDALDAEGRGVARNPDGKVVFVEGALPGERVAARKISGKRKFDLARATQILDPSPGRREPRCPHFGVCGGCATQHADERTQMAAKQRWLEDNLERIGKVRPESLLPIVYGPEWGYRRRARLSVRRVPSRGGVLVGFRERRSSFVAQMSECHVLPEAISELIPEMKALVEKLS
ncbi:MAG TPA: TRAM domain-containing protein, partial [Burkholderiales bacterium]|nr:TRAM domain-containing protein [Burkholderiales bacterium]